VGSGLLATGGAFTVRAQDASREVSALFDTGAKWDAQARATEARGRSANDTALALYVSGGVAFTAGLAALVLGARHPKPAKLSIAPLPGGAALGWSCDY
jgi:hypothetical protein